MGPELNKFPHHNIIQSDHNTLLKIKRQGLIDERKNIIKSGVQNINLFNNLESNSKRDDILQIPPLQSAESNAYNNWRLFKFKSQAPSPMPSNNNSLIELLPEIQTSSKRVQEGGTQGNMLQNNSLIDQKKTIQTQNLVERIKEQKLKEEEERFLKRKIFIDRIEEKDREIDFDKAILKYQLKSPNKFRQLQNSTLNITNNNNPLFANLEFDMKEPNQDNVNITKLIEDSKKFNLNLKNFDGEDIFQLQQIVYKVMRKLSEIILQMKSINRHEATVLCQAEDSPLSSKLAQQNTQKITEIYKASQLKEWAYQFWQKILSKNLNHFQDQIRWDIIEENFIIFLLEKLNFSNEIFNMINWKKVVQKMHDECCSQEKNNEIPLSPSNYSQSLSSFKNNFVKKAKFIQFISSDGLYESLKMAVSIEQNIPLETQFQNFISSSSSLSINPSMYKYCDGSWFRGIRSHFQRSGGKSKLQFANGDCYEGDFMNGLRHGVGSIKYYQANSLIGKSLDKCTYYRGEFKNDLKDGMCTVEFNDGSKFHGQFKNNIQYYGTFFWPKEEQNYINLKEYTGFWDGYKMQGQGILSDHNEIQTGVFQDSKLNGVGIKQDVSGKYVVKGDFDKGIITGQNCFYENDQGKYYGDMVAGQIQGFGVMDYFNGDRYEGYWNDGQFEGKGKLSQKNKDFYEGTWSKGLKNGRGVLSLYNGEYYYEGEFKDDKKNGYGILKFISPSKGKQKYDQPTYQEYYGYFIQDLYHGKGKLTIYDNKNKRLMMEEYDGVFKNGMKNGFGRLIKLAEDIDGGKGNVNSRVALGENQGEGLTYNEYIGDFKNGVSLGGDGIQRTIKYTSNMLKLNQRYD